MKGKDSKTKNIQGYTNEYYDFFPPEFVHLRGGLKMRFLRFLYAFSLHNHKKGNVQFISILITYYVSIDGVVSFILPANVLERPRERDQREATPCDEKSENLVLGTTVITENSLEYGFLWECLSGTFIPNCAIS